MCFSLTITASCPMNLQYFPMDRQLCHIEIESCKYATYIRECTYIYTYLICTYYIGAYKWTKYDFTEFNIFAYITSTRHTNTYIHTYILTHIIMEIREIFLMHFSILLLRMTIDSPYLFGVNHARARVQCNFKKITKDFFLTNIGPINIWSQCMR